MSRSETPIRTTNRSGAPKFYLHDFERGCDHSEAMSFPENRLSKALHVKYPLIVAPMAGGPSTPELVIASSKAGALGSIGAAYLSPKAIEDFVLTVRSQTEKPFAINLFAPTGEIQVSESQLNLALSKTKGYRKELKIPEPQLVPPYEEDFDLQFEAVLRLKPRALSFIFGVLAPEYLKEARKEKIFLMGTATSLQEALMLEEAQVDAIVAQGIESGGHRGIFDPKASDPSVPVFELVKAIKAKIQTPIVVAGGIMAAQDIRRMLQAGADAVQMGTAFLACKEAGTSAPYRKKLLESPDRKTKTTRAFSGRWARGLVNRFMQEMDFQPEAILPFPAQNKFTRDLRSASLAAGSAEFLSLWSGTGQGDLWTGAAHELIESLFLK